MLKIDEGHHILEVGCGTGKLVPLLLQLKKRDVYYLVSDLSINMVELTKEHLQSQLKFYQS